MKMQGFGSGRLVLTPKIYRGIPIDSQGIVSYTTLALLKQLITDGAPVSAIPIDVGFEIERPEQKVCSGRVFGAGPVKLDRMPEAHTKRLRSSG